ncbi:MAG: hypothetical protein ACRC33_09690 [Gemmataceae bacterium]
MRGLMLAALLACGAAVVPAADPPGDDVQDVVFLGDARPVFVRLHVRSGDGGAFAGYDAFMDRLFRYLDRDGSGGLSRTEASRAPSVAQLNQYLTGNPYIVEARRAGMTTPFTGEELDADKDARVTPEELKAYYQGNGVGSLLVTNRTADAGGPADGDVLFGLLDADRDGRLSRAELQAADAGLMRLDQDDDELVSATELGVRPAQAPQPEAAVAAMPAAEKAAPRYGMELVPRGDRRLAARMDAARKVVERYDKDKDGRLTEAEVGFAREAFAKLDRNRDRKLDALEIGRWLTGTPDTEQTISLAAPTAPARRPAGVPAGNVMTMGGLQLTVLGEPLTAGLAFDYKGQLLGQFRTFDVDKLGFLTRRQVDGETGGFMRAIIAVADRNLDGRMTRQELVDYLDLVRSAALGQVSITLSSSGQRERLFQALDENGDGYLSMRELRNAWQRLSPFDADRAGVIARAALPTQVRLTVGRGGTGRQPDAGPADAGRPVPTRGPLWFRKMDRNGDGDVSRVEWLGGPEDFARADENGDGLIGVDEAEALDANRRK